MISLADFLPVLDLEPVEVNLFKGRAEVTRLKRVFGGLVLGQAVVACQRTVESRILHSLHAYFILPGDAAAPIVYEVERIRDGGSFTTRRCVAIQHGRPIFALSASFQVAETGFDHATPMPEMALPDLSPEIPPFADSADGPLSDGLQKYRELRSIFDLRPALPITGGPTPRWPAAFWLRARDRLPDDPALHQAVLVYLSDLTLIGTALGRHASKLDDPNLQVSSLDHALWLHRPLRIDEWLLYAQDSPNASGGRGLARGAIFQRDGTLVASVAQEGLMRIRSSGAPKA